MERYSNIFSNNVSLLLQFAFKNLMFTRICRSHYVSHFATFFIVMRAKISIVKSCLFVLSYKFIIQENCI